MALDEILTLVPPPAETVDTLGDWSIAEKEFGLTFPADYKQFIETYGSGEFQRGLIISNLLTQEGRDRVREDLARYEELKEACEHEYILYPECPGLFPWGSDSNGHLYCWWTEGEPDEWGIVQLFHGYEDDPLEIVPGPITSFFVRFMSNAYSNMLGGIEFEPDQLRFTRGPQPV
ncbi:SMI1/KNR4 family protein [Blastopirellula sp. JC732]|uniref:SMI1/KNR4 family protein n=1 Tax=Blastopirellula sediminis TaxID=2894196 RepID=A0A9X1MSZ5_9BACT|nr:SMI1/KNR4 family protein [Blastopirellula sediminis]MCC9604766.1 SMI1/KNR4 family protein [Blastopirellula sediminis]MCC9631935.1 SMI1/KNR4 family protein [Blastopirellula sediminis]